MTRNREIDRQLAIAQGALAEVTRLLSETAPAKRTPMVRRSATRVVPFPPEFKGLWPTFYILNARARRDGLTDIAIEESTVQQMWKLRLKGIPRGEYDYLMTLLPEAQRRLEIRSRNPDRWSLRIVRRMVRTMREREAATGYKKPYVEAALLLEDEFHLPLTGHMLKGKLENDLAKLPRTELRRYYGLNEEDIDYVRGEGRSRV